MNWKSVYIVLMYLNFVVGLLALVFFAVSDQEKFGWLSAFNFFTAWLCGHTASMEDKWQK